MDTTKAAFLKHLSITDQLASVMKEENRLLLLVLQNIHTDLQIVEAKLRISADNSPETTSAKEMISAIVTRLDEVVKEESKP